MNNRPNLKKISLYCFTMTVLLFLMGSHLPLADATVENDLYNDGARRSGVITLTTPKNARVVTGIGVELEWNVTGVDEGVMEFDVYVSEDEAMVTGKNAAVRFAADLKDVLATEPAGEVPRWDS